MLQSSDLLETTSPTVLELDLDLHIVLCFKHWDVRLSNVCLLGCILQSRETVLYECHQVLRIFPYGKSHIEVEHRDAGTIDPFVIERVEQAGPEGAIVSLEYRVGKGENGGLERIEGQLLERLKSARTGLK